MDGTQHHNITTGGGEGGITCSGEGGQPAYTSLNFNSKNFGMFLE